MMQIGGMIYIGAIIVSFFMNVSQMVPSPYDPAIDKGAKRMKDGSWKCSVCITQDMLSLFGAKTQKE